MHRSGTSLLTRLLNLLGVELGQNELLTTEPIAGNPRGYWEHHELTAISDAILHRYGGSWDEPPPLPKGWQLDPAIDDLRLGARTLIKEQLADSALWGWKDPRTCLTLPFWQELLPELHYIICLRNPVDVAASLARRDNFSKDKSFYLWLTYVSHALFHSQGKPRLLVFYDDLIDDSLANVQLLGNFLGIPERANNPTVRMEVQKFIEPALRHHRSINPSNSNSNLEVRALTLFSMLRDSTARE